MAIDLRQTAIDPDVPTIPPTRNTQAALRAALDDLQGNILKSHGRDHSRHLLITFKTDTPQARKASRDWLTSLVRRGYVTSALAQYGEAAGYREVLKTARADGAVTAAGRMAMVLSVSPAFVGAMVSAQGYRELRLDTAFTPDDPAFLAGAKSQVGLLNDPPVTAWEPAFQRTLHAMVIVADDDPAQRIDPLVKLLSSELAAMGAEVAVESGTAMRFGPNGEPPTPTSPVHEHFGFADGVSQPLFYARDIERARTRNGGIDEYDPSAPLNQVLLKDPAGGDDGYGSYFVYRKLEQDVPGFHGDEEALGLEIAKHADAKAHQAAPEDVALAGAYMVGRFKDGTPVVDQQQDGLVSLPNNFGYDSDVDGVRCPVQAHIRKTNPRGDKQRQFAVPLTQERTQRIARRGISFGPVTLTPGPTDKVGLLFLCAQSSIPDQFEFIQKAWSNFEDFLRPDCGLDPVIGQLPSGESRDEAVAQPWPKQYASHNQLDVSQAPPKPTDVFFRKRVGQWVTMRGGEYFFVPSLSGLLRFGDLGESQGTRKGAPA
ncbi:Dyp-type peroxidase family [Catenulispora sp. GP43]|uniref:Dyp-type peroxidase n=1 Tax=Catenulispora sp. GP43 TaxID=3156263 RepID=UPI003514F620